MIRAAILGASTPEAGELTRLLIHHPDIEIAWLHEPELAGELVTDVHPGLLGETYLRFTDTLDWDGVNAVFVCHSEERPAIPATLKIIDLTGSNVLPDDGHDFIYALPEINRKPLVRGGRLAAVPSALAAAIELALFPLAKNGLMPETVSVSAAITAETDDEDIVLSPLTHFSATEASRALGAVSGNDPRIELMTFALPWRRGAVVAASMPMPAGKTVHDIKALYDECYEDHSFTFVSASPVAIKEVTGTLKSVIHVEEARGKLVVSVTLDDRLKGGAGTAIHAMNLMFGLHEKVGLTLKALG